MIGFIATSLQLQELKTIPTKGTEKMEHSLCAQHLLQIATI
jgi:hypothetical protein